MPALPPTGLARCVMATQAPEGAFESASPTRSTVYKSTPSCSCFYHIPDYSPYNSITLLLCTPSTYHNSDTHADHRQPGPTNHPSEITRDPARPAAQRASGPTARSAGGRTTKPRAAICAGASRFPPGRARAERPAARTGERPVGASRMPGSSAAPGVESSPRPEELRRAESEACADLASTAIEAERPPGAEPWSERESSPERPASAPSRSHGIDQPEARACPRPGRSSALGDRREPLGMRCGLLYGSRWSA